MAAGEDASTKHQNQRQQPNSGLDGTVAPGELEVERRVVDGDETSRVHGGRASEQHDGVVIPEEVARKQSVLQGGKHGEALLQAENEKEHARDDEQGNDLAAVPVVERPAQVDAHDETGDGAEAEERAHKVELADEIGARLVGLRLLGRDEEEVDGGAHARHAQVEVESPSPRRRRLSEGAAYDWAKHTTDTPGNSTVKGTQRSVSKKKKNKKAKEKKK